MLAVYRKSLLIRTPTPLRERLGRLAAPAARCRQAIAGVSPGISQAGGLPLQSQYDLSDSFIASGGFLTDILPVPICPYHADTMTTGGASMHVTLALPSAHESQQASQLNRKTCYVLVSAALSALQNVCGPN
jgi:hypothetical protein